VLILKGKAVEKAKSKTELTPFERIDSLARHIISTPKAKRVKRNPGSLRKILK